MHLATVLLIVSCASATVAPAWAEDPPPPPKPRPPVLLDFPVLEFPYNVPDGAFPSMRQSLMISKDAYHSLGVLAEGLESKGMWGLTAVIGLELLYYYLPLGDAWLHEEYHRAVMSRRDVSSFNDVYRFKLLASTISVSHVRDEDLVRLKREHPAEQVRLGAAGIEGERDLLLELKKDRFFEDDSTGLPFFDWLVQANASLYLVISGTSEGDQLTDELNAEDGADVDRRDFTGLDFTGWVYDLHRPQEPYQARGIHPSGVGIDRYRKLSHLTRQEQDYLKLQGVLTFLNFADPSLVGLHGFGKPGGTRWTAFLRHDLTPFGYAIGANAFFRRGRYKVAGAARVYSNDQGVLPGIEAQLLRFPLSVGGYPISLTPRLAFWFQPKDLLFRSRDAEAGGLLSLRAAFGDRRVQPYLEVEAKTAGWVAGNPYLDGNVSARVGLTLRAFERSSGSAARLSSGVTRASRLPSAP